MKTKLVVILIIISLIITSQMIVVGNEINFEDNKNEDTREDIEKIENGSVDIDEKNKRSEKENDIKENYFDQTDLREKKQRNDLGGYNVSLSAKYTYETQDPIRIDSDENFAEVVEEKN